MSRSLSAPVPAAPRRSLHLLVKLAVLVIYIALLLLTRQRLSLCLYAGVILLATFGLRLPLRYCWPPLLALLAPLALLFLPAGIVRMTLLNTSRLFCLLQLFTLLEVTTQTSELLLFLGRVARWLPSLQAPLYVLSSTLAVLPSIRQDIRKSIDVTILRRGSRMIPFFSIETWGTILTDVLVRTVLRGQRLADAVIERGFLLSAGLTPLPTQRFRFLDALLGVVLVVPGLVIYRVTG